MEELTKAELIAIILKQNEVIAALTKRVAEHAADVEIDVKFIKYEIYQVVYPQCNSVVIGNPPGDCKGTVNYGDTIRSMAMVLTQYANVGIDISVY